VDRVGGVRPTRSVVWFSWALRLRDHSRHTGQTALAAVDDPCEDTFFQIVACEIDASEGQLDLAVRREPDHPPTLVALLSKLSFFVVRERRNDLDVELFGNGSFPFRAQPVRSIYRR
jgi:hypothetical protein